MLRTMTVAISSSSQYSATWFCAILCALLGTIPAPADQYGAGHLLARINFDSTSTSSFPGNQLRPAISQALDHSALAIKRWADRACVYDLNRDGRSEYFVPLDCGATGNCTWAVITTSPVRLLATVSAATIYVLKATDAGPWEILATYSGSGAGEGHVAEYAHNRDGLYAVIDEQDISGVVNDAFLVAMDGAKLGK